MFKVTNPRVENPSNSTVEVLDSIMGSGKSTEVIKWIDSNTEERFIYVSPLLSEVEDGGRIHQALEKTVFETPTDSEGSKSEHFLELLKEGVNIACTHSLYLGMTSEHFYQIKDKGYIVIIDEEIDVIESFDKYSNKDLEWLIANEQVDIAEDDGMVSWVGDRTLVTKEHKYHTMLSYCDAKALYTAKRSDSMMVTQLPIKLFESSKRVIILTYMFKGNVLDKFLQLKGFNVVPFTEVTVTEKSKSGVKRLLKIVPPSEKLKKMSMSSTWYRNKATSEDIRTIGNFIRTLCLNERVLSKDVAWCVPKFRVDKVTKVDKNLIKPKGFIVDSEGNPCYLPVTTRATNKYRNKKVMIHCFDRYPHISVASYLEDYGYRVDSSVFALSEMLQWAWRGCIRDDQPMTLAIGSKRMYNLFKEWLEKDDEI